MAGLRGAFLLAAMGAGYAAYAQTGLVGEDRFPQFRSQGVLPGTGASLMPDGRISPFGAVTHSTPVAYGFAPLRFAVMFDALSRNLSLASPDSGGGDQIAGNGTAGVMGAIPIGRFGNLTGSWMILSDQFDNVGSAQFTPRTNGPVKFAVGVQDYWGNGGSSGENLPGDNDSSTSWYAVASTEFRPGIHGSLGIGTKRFGPMFGSVSAALNDRTAAYIEHDSFNLNYGLRFSTPLFTRVASGWGRDAEKGYAFINIGVVANKYAYWGVSVAF
jgi:hypothetical protein